MRTDLVIMSKRQQPHRDEKCLFTKIIVYLDFSADIDLNLTIIKDINPLIV